VSAKFNRCTIQIRKLPLETFRLPRDGRKWKQLARSRYGLLLEISTFANGDGSFLSPDPKINFSPSFTKLLVHRSRDTLYRLANDIRELGLLSWHRNNHYGRRFYEIHLPEKQVRYSPENRSDIRGENRSDIQNNRSDQEDVITGPTSRPYPSLESLPSGGSPSASPPLVSDQNRLGEHGVEHADHHHRFSPNTGNRKPKPDDDDECVSPKAVVPETPEQPGGVTSGTPEAPSRIELLIEKAKTLLVNKGHERDYVEISLERIDQRSYESGKTPVNVAYFLTAFQNQENDQAEKALVWDLAAERRARRAKFGIPLDLTTLRLTPEQEEARRSFNERPVEKVVEDVRRLVDESGSHDELLKDETHCGKLRWAGRYIVASAPTAVARFLTRDTVQALTGCSTEHMVENLRANGFWAEVYEPGGEASHVSDTPEPPAKTETPPPSPENNSPDTELPETYEEAVALLQFENPKLDHDQAWERIEHFANRTGEFSDEEKWQRFVELLRRLRVEQRQATEQRQAKRAARNQRRRKRRKQRRTAGP
jgi:hypothetical protein